MTFPKADYMYNKNMVIYITTHLPTGKKYIGKDKANNPNYYGSGTNIRNIIQDEGTVNLKKDIIEQCLSPKHLAEREKYWLEKYDVENNPLFLNKTNKPFGNSGQTPEGKIKISKALKGMKQTKLTRDRKSQSIQKYWDNVSEEERKSRALSISIALKGKKRSEEHKMNISKGRKNKPCPGNWKEVEQYDLENNLIRTFQSAIEAKTVTGLKIQNALTGRAKHCGGFIWKYKTQ